MSMRRFPSKPKSKAMDFRGTQHYLISSFSPSHLDEDAIPAKIKEITDLRMQLQEKAEDAVSNLMARQ